MKEPGYVYILTNPSFREDWVKIGKSSRPVDVRSKELDNTAVPLPFEIFATMKTVKYNEVEKLVHKTIDRLTDLRIRQNREFFNVAPQLALDIFRDIASTIDDAEIILYEDSKPISEDIHKEVQKREVKRARFKFSMCDIKIGELITFTPTGIQVKVLPMTPLNTKVAFTNSLLSWVLSCRKNNGIIRELIKVRSTLHIMGRCWMRLEKKRKIQTIKSIKHIDNLTLITTNRKIYVKI